MTRPCPPGATARFTLAPGKYDTLARDCDRQVIEEVRGGTISGRTAWTITGEEGGAEAAPTARPAATARPGATARPAATPLPAATPRPVALDQFLCCGRTAGETRIWGISYPHGWEVTLLPEDPNYFLGAFFADPRSSMRIIIIPSGWTPMGTAMDTGDVDDYLDALAAARAAGPRIPRVLPPAALRRSGAGLGRHLERRRSAVLGKPLDDGHGHALCRDRRPRGS